MFKNKSIFYGTDEELDEMIAELGLEPVKDNDKMTIFRKPQKEKTDDQSSVSPKR